MVRFQDSHTAPPPPTATATMNGGGTTSTAALKIPETEPKLEPLYEEDPYSSHINDFYNHYNNQQQQQRNGSRFSHSTLDYFNYSQTTPPLAASSSCTITKDEESMVSEYNRIKERFNNAFSTRQTDGESVSVLDSDCGAIVPHNADESSAVLFVHKRNRRNWSPRSGDLVRVLDLEEEDGVYFREVVRHARMVYDALRIYSVLEEEKRFVAQGIVNRRLRGDLLAATVMRDRGVWLNRGKRIVGHVPGVEIGDVFFFRMELCVIGIHGQTQAGIDYVPASLSSTGEPIATSVIVSGGYEDDEDVGDVIIYTGHGGQDKFSRQCMHQKLEGGNLALERSMHYEIEVRVIRGFKYEGSLSSKVYVYDGLYKVVDCWFDMGRSGFGVYKYRLVRIEGQQEMGSSVLKFALDLKKHPLVVRPKGYLSLDISDKKENVPILLFNDVDDANVPLCYEYIARTAFPPHVYGNGNSRIGCNCVDNCIEGCACAMKNGGQFAYDQNGFLVRGKPVIYECGPFCACPPSCRNRVTQRGLRHRLEVFRSVGTGWGVRSLDLIHAGSFICEYTGIILTKEQAEIFSMNGDILIYPGRFTNRWAEWGDLSDVYPDYEFPTYPSIPPVEFAVDISRMRNVACYMSHSPAPNVLVQYVLYDHNNLMFPHLMLFAMENIPPLREISLDYGVMVCNDSKEEKLAICNWMSLGRFD